MSAIDTISTPATPSGAGRSASLDSKPKEAESALDSLAAMGIEGFSAALAIASSREIQAQMRALGRQELGAQIDDLHRQVSSLHDKADAVRAEGLISGLATAAGGAVAVASAFAGPSAFAREHDESLHGELLQHPSAGAGAAYASFDEYVQREARIATAMGQGGQTIGQIGTQIAKGTAGAAQIDHDADAMQAAADARFHESAKDDFEAIARDAKGIIDRVEQTLQQMRQERDAVARSILRA